MAHINLLPWREEQRKQRQKEFGVMAALAAVFAVAVVGLAHVEMVNRIDGQNQRNAYLEKEIQILDTKIARIKELEKTKAGLLARMNVIQQLQGSRPESVHLMDQLVQTLPDGVHLTNITQKGKGLKLVGKAQSNARVSAYMRNIDGSEWMGNPKLNVIKSQDGKKSQKRISDFTMVAKQTRPKAAAIGGAK